MVDDDRNSSLKSHDEGDWRIRGRMNLLYRRNLDASQAKWSRDPAPPFLRAAQARLSFGSGLLTLLTYHLMRNHQICYHCTIHNLCQPELIPRQLSPSACPCRDVICVFPIAAHSKNVYLTLAFAPSFLSSYLSFLPSSLLPLQQDLLFSFPLRIFTSAHAELCTL
jgi:hypothetical protein